MATDLASLVQAAGAAASAGRWQDAEALWKQVLAREPAHVQALFSLGVHAYRGGEHAVALDLLQQARGRAPGDPMVHLAIARIHGDRDEPDAEWRAIGGALQADPYFLPGLLAKAEHLERRGRVPAAAAVFRDALKVAPDEARWPAALRRRLQHARESVRDDADALSGLLAGRIAASRASLDGADGDRWDEAVSILAGRSRPYHAECNQLHVPRLPATTFHDRALFPWIPALERATGSIRAELESLVASGEEGFTPYVAYAPGTPVNQWGELNHSRAWSAFHLWAHGAPVAANLARCPRTAEALAAIEAVEIAGLCPNAMFSALAPRTRIPPHHGETNARLVAHLPLVVPAGCRFRVGHDWREWREGEVMVFDDSIEHEARNDGDALRVVLIFDVWNPALSTAERGMVQSLSAAMQEHRGSRQN